MSKRPSSVALEAIIARFADQVRRVGEQHGLSGGDVEELIQEVRVRLWGALENPEQIQSVAATYIYRTAASAALDLIRRRRARRETPYRLDRPSAEATLGRTEGPDQVVEGVEVEGQVNRAIEALPGPRRSVIRMYLAGYNHTEISALLGWTEAKTRNLLYRALADLRARLAGLGIGPGQSR
jgi:RNA polymerase sigma-70 factor (ECF subfamily)